MMPLEQLLDATIHVFLPHTWVDYGDDGLKGPPVSDPLMIYIYSENIDIKPLFQISFEELVKDFLTGEMINEGIVGIDSVEKLKKLSDALKRITGHIDGLITNAR